MSASPLPAATAAQHASQDLVAALVRYMDADTQKASLSQEVWAELEPEMPGILDRFYADILAIPALAEIFEPHAAGLDRIKAAQTGHWAHILTETPDRDFHGRAIRIAEAHVRIGLPQHWYLAAYGRVLCEAISVILRGNRFNARRTESLLHSLVVRIFLDISLAQDGYENGVRERYDNQARRELNLANLKNIAQTVTDVNELSLNMAILSSNTEEATANSQAISAAAEELVASVGQIAENSDGAAERATETNQSVARSIDAMSGAAEAISEISTATQESVESLAELHRASAQIGDFLAVIQTIADQTNLLALNATIEAARAGEAGKGFAVVASEVKSLANQAARATEDISERIKALQDGMTDIQTSMDGSREAVVRGQTTIGGANHLIRSVGEQVSDVAERMQEISTILQQQQTTSAEISANITGVADKAAENRDRLTMMSTALQNSNDNFVQNARSWFRIDCHRSLVQMAKIDHIFFKKHVVDMMLGRVEGRADELSDHHACRLGKWYDGTKLDAICQHAAFRSISEPHEQIHRVASEMIALRDKGETQQAITLLPALEEASASVLEGLDALAEALETDLSMVDARSHIRQPVEGMKAAIRSKSGEREVDVLNVSAGGLGVSGIHSDEVGSILEIRIDDQDLLGEMVWTDGAASGIRILKGKVYG